MTNQAVLAGYEFEGRVRRFMRDLKLRDVGGGADFVVGNVQVDCCGGWDDALIVVECLQTSGTASIHDLISEVRGKYQVLRNGFRKIPKYESYKRLFIAIATRGVEYSEGDRQLASGNTPKVFLIDDQILSYYEKLAGIIDRGAMFNFLGEFGITPRDGFFPRLPAFRVRLDRALPAYLFWAEPYELLQVAYVAHRESGQFNFYQRFLNKERLKRIKKYVDDGGIFPNNVIIAFDKKPEFRVRNAQEYEVPDWIEFGELIFPKSYRAAWVIDGQHRLFSFGLRQQNAARQKLAVLAFESMPRPKQAQFFIDINHEQKPVETDLILDLEGELRPQGDRGKLANVIKALNEREPLKGRIASPLTGQHKRGQIKMSGLSIELEESGLLNAKTHSMTQAQNNPFWSPDPDVLVRRVADALAEFLQTVSGNLREEVWNSLAAKPGGITLMIKVYEQILARLNRKPTPADLRQYSEALTLVLEEFAPTADRIRQITRDLTSFAQRRELLREVLLQMREVLDDPEFAKNGVPTDKKFERVTRFERKLSEFICNKLDIQTLDNLKDKASEDTWRNVSKTWENIKKESPSSPIHEALGLGDVKQILARKDNKAILIPQLTGGSRGFVNEGSVTAALDEISTARNPMMHGRARTNKSLVDAYLETFEGIFTATA